MNVGTKIGIAVGAGALGALGAGAAISAMRSGYQDAGADVRRQTADARTEFDSWNAKLQERFPGGKLDTPQDHRAFEALLRDNPAPEWLHVKHEGFTDVHTQPGEMVEWPRRLSSETPGAGIGFALTGAAGGAYALWHGITRASSTATTIASIVGGVAALSIGAVAGYSDIGSYNADTGADERARLIADATLPR